MKPKLIALGTLIAFSTSAAAQSAANAAWIGVWHGERHGQPSVTLTLAEDTGELGGTVVLNILSLEGGQLHVIAAEPHILVHPLIEGDQLTFQLKRIDKSSAPMNFTVTRNSGGKAQIHCLNCGADAPVVDLVQAQ
jgi:hypothetical protein